VEEWNKIINKFLNDKPLIQNKKEKPKKKR
jgi:hypothetical protein